jgi:hypothetical protein
MVVEKEALSLPVNQRCGLDYIHCISLWRTRRIEFAAPFIEKAPIFCRLRCTTCGTSCSLWDASSHLTASAMFSVANISVEHKEYIVRVAHIGEVFLSHALGCRQVLNLSYKFVTKKAMVRSAHSTKICLSDLTKRSPVQCCAHLYKILLLVKPCSGLYTVILISIC